MAGANPNHRAAHINRNGVQQVRSLIVINRWRSNDRDNRKTGTLSDCLTQTRHKISFTRVLNLAHRIEHARCSTGRDPIGGGRQRHSPRSSHVGNDQRSRNRYSVFERITVTPLSQTRIQNNQMVRTSRFLKLANNKAPGVSGHWPVDISTVITGNVITKRVE